jgi:hypothetical protein
MYCPNCGVQNANNATSCTNCGNILQSIQTPRVDVPPPHGHGPRAYVPNYLVPAILTTLFCCIPFGIVSIVYAAQVDSKVAAGDRAGALESSRKARTWAWLAFGTGLVIVVGYILFFLLFALLGASSSPPR